LHERNHNKTFLRWGGNGKTIYAYGRIFSAIYEKETAGFVCSKLRLWCYKDFGVLVFDTVDDMRVFIAVEIPDNVRALIASAADMLEFEGIRLVQERNLHITMLFLGEISADKAEQVKEVVSQLRPGGFDVSIDGLGVFTPRLPKIIYAKVVDHSKDLARTYGFLRTEVEKLGIMVDSRQYVPHITLGRMNTQKKIDYDELNSVLHRIAINQRFHCAAVSLKSSSLSGEGPTYKDIYSLKLNVV
jgi:2'-5' RNA ligase